MWHQAACKALANVSLHVQTAARWRRVLPQRVRVMCCPSKNIADPGIIGAVQATLRAQQLRWQPSLTTPR